ncbi:hypothetical protein B0T17DRAFT_528955 [Bombardia bombarda]|uniref:Secreted protein n=1 Tax=Bombardia bombarda TaxID=252184 RepID=A0AA39XB35_9PEZI|nr:hypothetical protein B0T17DRAFT_528955 [Bombardia bombarda]
MLFFFLFCLFFFLFYGDNVSFHFMQWNPGVAYSGRSSSGSVFQRVVLSLISLVPRASSVLFQVIEPINYSTIYLFLVCAITHWLFRSTT